MSDYYKSKYVKKLYDPKSHEAFKLSRTKIDLFLECPRCFYMDRRSGVSRPKGPAFTLNVAVDTLLKKEFDIHRANKQAHPLMKTYGINAVPFQNENMNKWRENFVGAQALHKLTNFLIFGAVDDIWVSPKGELFVVDYKATSKEGEIFLEDTRWHNQYRRQMEVYQWLVRQNGFKVSDTGYFVYVNGKKDREAFDGKLEFDVKIIDYTGSDAWVEGTLLGAKRCLDGDLPEPSPSCEFCSYRTAAGSVEQKKEVFKPDRKSSKPRKKSTASKTAPSLF